jgi:lipid-binding SYLF domain-containing protein
MAYATTNPPNCIIPRMGAGGTALWSYRHTDIHTDVDAAGYFTNGDALGMKVGDVVLVSKSDATIGTTVHYVQTVTAGGAATVALAILA